MVQPADTGSLSLVSSLFSEDESELETGDVVIWKAQKYKAAELSSKQAFTPNTPL